jgi:hypothetical protein
MRGALSDGQDVDLRRRLPVNSLLHRNQKVQEDTKSYEHRY